MRLDFPLPVPIRPGVRRTGEEAPWRGRTPRISRLMALAIRFDGLLSQGAVRNRRELAEAGHVSRARLSQILQLNHLAPEIQEQLLFLPPTRRGPDPLLERHLRAVARLADWEGQNNASAPCGSNSAFEPVHALAGAQEQAQLVPFVCARPPTGSATSYPAAACPTSARA